MTNQSDGSLLLCLCRKIKEIYTKHVLRLFLVLPAISRLLSKCQAFRQQLSWESSQQDKHIPRATTSPLVNWLFWHRNSVKTPRKTFDTFAQFFNDFLTFLLEKHFTSHKHSIWDLLNIFSGGKKQSACKHVYHIMRQTHKKCNKKYLKLNIRVRNFVMC